MRSPHEATCRSIASRSQPEDATMSSINTISLDKLTRLLGTPNCPVLLDVRTEEDFNANPALIPSSMRRPMPRRPDWAQRIQWPLRNRDLPEGRQAQPRRGRLVASRRRAGGRARGRLRGLAQGRAAAGAGGQDAAARSAETHRLGHPRAAQGRPHCLSMADPPLCRSARGVPVRRRHRRSKRSPSASRPRRSTSRACSGAIAASAARST